MREQHGQVLRRFRQHAAAFRLGQLHQLFRQSREFLERGFNLRGACLQRPCRRIVAQPLNLGEGCRQGRAQFMRAVGGKPAFAFQRATQAFEQVIDGIGDGPDLRRKPAAMDRRQVADAARLDRQAIATHAAQTETHEQPDAEQAGRYQEQQRQQQGDARIAGCRLPIGKRFGDLQEQGFTQGTGAIQAMRRGAGEAAQREWAEHGRVGAEGLQKDIAPAVTHHVGKAFLLRGQRRHPLRQDRLLAIENIQNSQWQDALRGFQHGIVESLVEPVPHDQPGHQRGQQPEQHKPQREAVNKLPLQALRRLHAVPNR